MKLIPFGDRLLVKRFEPPAATSGGLLLASGANDFSQMAEIVEIGHLAVSAGFKKGEKVLLTKFSGANASIDGQEFLLVRSEDILGKFVGE